MAYHLYVNRGIITKFGWPSVLLVAVEALLVIGVLWGILAYQGATAARNRSNQALIAVDQMMIALLDVETGMRGYVLTGDDSFLVPYQDAIEVVNARHSELRIALSEEKVPENAIDELTRMVTARLAEAGQLVTLRQSGDEERALAVVREGAGKDLMDAVRERIAVIRDDEQGRLDSRSTFADRVGITIGVLAICLALATAVVVVWLLVVLRRRQDQEALESLARAKDEFVGFVSHELRTPIALIAGNARVLEGESLTAHEREDALQEVALAADRLQDIVDTLLNLAKAESGVPLAVEPVLLHRIAQTVRKHHARRYPQREVVVSTSEEVPPAMGDRVAIEQVLINLLSNAEKYGSPDGPISIAVGSRNNVVNVAVTNPGPQLDHAQFEHIFEPFFRMPAQASSAPGIGLGLTICHRLIIAQGGKMSAEARDEGGATFRLELPQASLDFE